MFPILETSSVEDSSDEFFWIALTESEITESEGDEDGEVGRVDFAGIFDRQIRASGHFGEYVSRPFVVSNRFSNPCEIFRVLRC